MFVQISCWSAWSRHHQTDNKIKNVAASSFRVREQDVACPQNPLESLDPILLFHCLDPSFVAEEQVKF